MTKKKKRVKKIVYNGKDQEACQRDGYHVWSYDEYGKPTMGATPEFQYEDLTEIGFDVECVRCGATAHCHGNWDPELGTIED